MRNSFLGKLLVVIGALLFVHSAYSASESKKTYRVCLYVTDDVVVVTFFFFNVVCTFRQKIFKTHTVAVH